MPGGQRTQNTAVSRFWPHCFESPTINVTDYRYLRGNDSCMVVSGSRHEDLVTMQCCQVAHRNQNIVFHRFWSIGLTNIHPWLSSPTITVTGIASLRVFYANECSVLSAKIWQRWMCCQSDAVLRTLNFLASGPKLLQTHINYHQLS